MASQIMDSACNEVLMALLYCPLMVGLYNWILVTNPPREFVTNQLDTDHRMIDLISSKWS